MDCAPLIYILNQICKGQGFLKILYETRPIKRCIQIIELLSKTNYSYQKPEPKSIVAGDKSEISPSKYFQISENELDKGYKLCKIEIEDNNNKDFHKFKKEIDELTLNKQSNNSLKFKELNDFIDNRKAEINKEKEISNKKKTGIESKEQGRFENDLKKEREAIKNNNSKLEAFLNLINNEEDIYKIKFNIFDNEKMKNETKYIYKEDEIEIFENIQNNSSNNQKTSNIDLRIEKNNTMIKNEQNYKLPIRKGFPKIGSGLGGIEFKNNNTNNNSSNKGNNKSSKSQNKSKNHLFPIKNQ
ncbi:hypothetical protein M0812_11574 [Anaeramoeba flamelloides]|uniref:Uncharacterized protein n=1 Tax=Anaeramoeba flamelloides TaxID=1746091 RepID=A0AAV7ZYK7_9EUKA|nr:hypothetical protein M0812_11574 [Anaeramoeba flamelloides]